MTRKIDRRAVELLCVDPLITKVNGELYVGLRESFLTDYREVPPTSYEVEFLPGELPPNRNRLNTLVPWQYRDLNILWPSVPIQ
jgi:hypothetical protein